MCIRDSGLVWSYLGGVTILVGIITLLPVLVLPAFPEEVIYAKYFIIPGVIAILGGYLLRFLLQGKAVGSLEKKQAALIVVCLLYTSTVRNTTAARFGNNITADRTFVASNI